RFGQHLLGQGEVAVVVHPHPQAGAAPTEGRVVDDGRVEHLGATTVRKFTSSTRPSCSPLPIWSPRRKRRRVWSRTLAMRLAGMLWAARVTNRPPDGHRGRADSSSIARDSGEQTVPTSSPDADETSPEWPRPPTSMPNS